MSKYKPESFNYSTMSERVKFQLQNADGTFTDDISVWAHILKDGFTRSETDNWYRVMVREHKALESALQIGNRIKHRSKTYQIFSWQDPSYEDRGFIEIMVKQIVSTDEVPTDIFKDIVSIYKLQKVAVESFGMTSYEYDYDFTSPDLTGVRCHFASDRNQYVYDKKTDVEHDSVIVKFSIETPISKEDYIESAVHGRFRVDMVIKTEDNMFEAHCSRTEVQ